MAASGKIEVTLGEGCVAFLDGDAPNVKEFVKTITSSRDSIDADKISVRGPSPEFDEESFRDIIVNLVTNYLEQVSIEERAYRKAIGDYEGIQFSSRAD